MRILPADDAPRAKRGSHLSWPNQPSLSLCPRVCHSETRAHVRLLGPCFKTGRMKPYDRQRPWRVSTRTRRDSPTVQTHCTQSAIVAEPAAEKGKPNGTHRDSSVRPDSVTQRYNTSRSQLPSSRTFQPVRTLVDASSRKMQCSKRRAPPRQSFGSALKRDDAPDT